MVTLIAGIIVIMMVMYSILSAITFIDGVIDSIYGRDTTHRLIYFIMPWYYVGYYILGPLLKSR